MSGRVLYVADFDPAGAYPPPSEARGNVGAAAGYVVIAALAALLVAVLVLLWLLGN